MPKFNFKNVKCYKPVAAHFSLPMRKNVDAQEEAHCIVADVVVAESAPLASAHCCTCPALRGMANAVHGVTQPNGFHLPLLCQEAFPSSPFVGPDFFACLFGFGEIVRVEIVFVVVVAAGHFADSQWLFEVPRRHWDAVPLKQKK
jgi:hypothetical protein